MENKCTVIAISNQKGGVGKTSTANSFAAGLKRKGFNVLTIDMDPQGNLSSSVDADLSENVYTIREVMKDNVDPREAIQRFEPFDLIPADISLAGYEQELISLTFGRDVRLRDSLTPLREMYDFIIIDTAPSLAMLTINALVAADEVIIPATAEFFATTGLEQLATTISNVRRYAGNPALRIAGVLFTLHDPRTINGQVIREQTAKYAESIGTVVYDTFIRKAVAMGESQTNRLDIYTFNPRSTVARDYQAFVNEYLDREGRVE